MEKPNMNDNTIGTEENSTKKTKMRGKKRKRNSSTESEDNSLPENALEVEKNVMASAAKNNLDDVSVKKILKKVVTNDHVLALVKLREEEEESNGEESGVRPKLTRAKVKELMKVSPKTQNAPWNLDNIELIPIKHIPVKTRPEVTALLAQELPEDEDDEEYKPSQDDVPSDDDQGLESCSDLDSQPRTPATPRSLNKSSPRVVNDGPFKMPLDLTTPIRRKLNLDEDSATIALRTRSKLSLSETPIESIESSFVPPDDLPMAPVVDHLWNEFLNECLNPASVTRNEDDDETDPEYNVAADQDAHDEDEEALEDTIIKISKKELNDLVTELFNIMPEVTAEDELAAMANTVTDNSRKETSKRWEGKEEPLSDDERPLTICEKLTFERRDTATRISIGKTEPMDIDDGEKDVGESAEASNKKKETVTQQAVVRAPCNVVRLSLEEEVMCVQPPPQPESIPPPALHTQPTQPRPQVISGAVILPEQVLILQQQLRQHVQVATSNFLQLYVNPLHWTMAPTYKEYLESLMKMVDENASSVVDVCNLRPAVELIRSWEKSVSQETPENTAMVEFIQKEAERWRRRSAQNHVYVGEFPEQFKQVVASSPVFLYPYLLPAMPYRADAARRYSYTRSEDELIVLGLDQFWQYVEDNPQLYPPPARPHPRHRWGLTAAAALVVKHMLPWLAPKVLIQHVHTARRLGDTDNPINNFFTNREIVPVKHRLLPYNPKMTLYEQPEHEMPRHWLRYLAKTSKRFRYYLQRRPNIQGQKPMGVDIEIGSTAVAPTKEPLPIFFTQEIKSPRINANPPKPVLADKFDVNIDHNKQPPLNFYKLVQTSKGATLVPLQMIDSNSPNVPLESRQTLQIKNLNLKNLLPAATTVQTNTVSCNVAPITTAFETQTESTTDSRVEPEKTDLVRETSKATGEHEHCSCCVLFKEICKVRQTVITDYFRSKNVKKSICPCRDKKYPNVTNKLKLLVRRYKPNGKYIYENIQKKLKIRNTQYADNNEEQYSATEDEYNLEDLAFVTSFQLKLTLRSMIAKNIHTKKRVHTLLRNFDLDWNDPVKLATELDHTFAVEMVDVSKEFVGFLNPAQADSIKKFRDYFIQNCAEKLVKQIEAQVTDEGSKRLLLLQMSKFFSEQQWSACSMCTTLLQLQREYPSLARYTFSLFPHVHESSKKTKPTKAQTKITKEPTETTKEQTPVTSSEPVNQEGPADTTLTNGDGPHATMDYEADDSSSGEENGSDTASIAERSKLEQEQLVAPAIITKYESVPGEIIDTPEMTISKTEVQDSESSDMSMMIMSEDELVKPEPLEWKRDEDKLILEMLKQHLTPEERKEKTILETIEDKQIVNVLSDSLTDKSFDVVKERVLYILKLLVQGES